MSPDELAVIKVGVETAAKPFSNLIEKLFGGAVEEIGGMWQDSLNFRRKARKERLLEKLAAKVEVAKFEPQQIPDYIWIPALTAAVQQDDETIEEKWANLLAAAADPTQEPMPPSFPKILAELTTSEAQFLDRLFLHLMGKTEDYKSTYPFAEPMKVLDLARVAKGQTDLSFEFQIELDNLLRLRVVEIVDLTQLKLLETVEPSTEAPYIRLSVLGIALLFACSGGTWAKANAKSASLNRW